MLVLPNCVQWKTALIIVRLRMYCLGGYIAELVAVYRMRSLCWVTAFHWYLSPLWPDCCEAVIYYTLLSIDVTICKLPAIHELKSLCVPYHSVQIKLTQCLARFLLDTWFHSISRPHPLQQMRPVATDSARNVVCVSVLGTTVSCAKTAEPIEMPFGM